MIDLIEMGKNAKSATVSLQSLSNKKINKVLISCADFLINSSDFLIEENKKDILKAKEKGISDAFIDRLSLSDKVISGMAEGLIKVAKLKCSVGKTVYKYKNKTQGILIKEKKVPFGVVGIIFESRPNVIADAFALCFKTKNAVILRGGSDAINSYRAIVKILRGALKLHGIDENVLSLIDDGKRETAVNFMKLNEYLDLLIPRGGASLINSVIENATVPVIETGKGNCHIYVDKYADINMAVKVILNAKTQRNSVCNACESLVVHKDILDKAINPIVDSLYENKVEIRCDEKSYKSVKGKKKVVKATEEDFSAEYNDAIISIKTVDSIEDAIYHINKYSTNHSESIITKNKSNAKLFADLIDSACVYQNASTRFSDGFVFGLGAEIGISTQKLHARGPMGLDGLLTTKYIIKGKGAVRK